MITDKELDFVRQALDMARRAGAQHARATLSKSEEDLVATLDGEVDRVTHCADRSLSLALFVDGRYGSYSTNKLDPASLEGFIARAVAATRMVAEDPLRVLPDPAEGDVVAVYNAGAYGFSMSSNYNSRPLCREVLVNDGKAELIREAETVEEQWRHQIIPERLMR